MLFAKKATSLSLEFYSSLDANPYQKLRQAGELPGQTALELALASNDRDLVDILEESVVVA